jgi:hypothetical protein
MEEITRKEIEAKLNKLLADAKKPKDTETPAKPAFTGARVIRRRKGQIDLHIN